MGKCNPFPSRFCADLIIVHGVHKQTHTHKKSFKMIKGYFKVSQRNRIINTCTIKIYRHAGNIIYILLYSGNVCSGCSCWYNITANIQNNSVRSSMVVGLSSTLTGLPLESTLRTHAECRLASLPIASSCRPPKSSL